MRVLEVVGTAAMLLGAAVVVPPGDGVRAIPVTPFGVAYTTNDNGAIFTIGNNLLTCPASASTCAAARAGTVVGAASSNNAYSMVNLDADADPTTFNSSSSDLLLPAGATVLWAGMFWGARRTGDPSGLATTAPIDQAVLRPPGASGYQTITSSKTYGPTGGGDAAYQQFSDITSIVQAAGNGPYWVGNVAAGLGRDRYAGWSIAVVYRDPTQPLRNLTVFDGFSDIAVNSSEVITVSGFLSPLSGTVDARVGLMAYEGDRGATGDSAFLNSTRLATAVSPGTNFFNSANDLDGRNITTRTPADDNMLGFDIARVGVPGAIPNGATSATVTVSTTSERYYVGWVTTQINLYAPDFTTSRKTSTDLAGRSPALPGDTIQYTLTYANTGGDPATGAVAEDPLPAGTAYVPGSLEIVDGPNAGAKTDATGDDQGEVVGGVVRVRLGTGATAATGGTIAPGATTTVRFLVAVGDSAAGTTVRNRATLDYVAQTVNQPFRYVGNETADPVSAAADLGLTKTTTPDPLVAGGTATSTLTVTNAGPSPATNVVIDDSLDAGIVPTAATVPGGSCTITGQAVRCSVSSLAAGASVAATVVATAPPDVALTAFSNQAQVASDVADPDPADNVAGATVGVIARADVSVTKSVSNPTPPPGLPVTYTITVTNVGPSTAMGVTADDTIDPRLTVASVAAPCATAGLDVHCAFGDLAPGQSATGTFDAMLVDGVAAGTVVPNTATVTSSTPDANTANQTATVDVTAAPPQADLAATKSGPASVVAGQPASYTIDIVNNGPSAASAVQFTDALPPGASVVSTSSSRGTCSAPPLATCALGDMPAGAAARVTVNVSYSPDAPLGTATNVASVTSPTADPVAANGTGSASTTVTGTSDLSIVKTATPLQVVAGGSVTYTITVANAGPSTAGDVTVTDLLPGAFDLVGASASQGTCAPGTGTLDCLLGAIHPGDTVQVVVTMAVPAGFPGGDVANAASVSAPNVDPDPSDNSATFTNTTSAAADVSLTKAVTPTPVVAGGTVTWTLTVANAGPSDASSVILDDPLPVGVDPATVTAVPSVGSCSAAGVVSCSLGTIASGATATVVITADLLPDGGWGDRLVNVARVTTSTLDPTSSNNVATTGSDVVRRADLTVTKTPGSDPVRSGEVEPFTIVVTNNGPSTAEDVKLLDHWDANWEGVTGPLCRFVQDDIECDVAATIPPGQTAGFIVFLYPFDDPGTYLNTVTVATATPESDPTNNAATVPVTVLPPEVDLHLTKAVAAPLVAGGPFAYDLVLTNDGPSIADVATVSDTLPAGLVPQAATIDGGTCAVTGQLVSCSTGFVFPAALGDARAMTIVGVADPAFAGAVATNTATATAAGETDASDDTATTTDAVGRVADVSVEKQVDAERAVAGGRIVYTVAVTNAGPSTAGAAVLTDLLPAAVTFDPELSDPVCTVPTLGDPVTCDLSTVGVGETVNVRIGGTIDPTFTGGSLPNVAQFDSDANAPVSSNTVAVPVDVLADLALTKVATGDAVPAGGQVEYTITVANDGPSAASAVQFDDQLPAGTTLVSVVPTAPLTCTTMPCVVGTLLPGDTASVVLTLQVPADRAPGPLDNTATADSPTPDPNPGRRTSTATVEVIRTADVSVQKVLRTEPVVAGQPVTYDLVVSNAGPSVADDVTITDALPPGTTLVSGSLGGPPCEQSSVDGTLTVACTLPSLSVGASFTGMLTLSTDQALAGALTNTAVVGAAGLDRSDSGNTSTAVGLVIAPPTTEPTTVPPTTMPPTTAPPTTAPPTPPPPTPAPPPATTAPAPGELPATGRAFGAVLLLGGGLLLGGSLLRPAARRRLRR